MNIHLLLFTSFSLKFKGLACGYGKEDFVDRLAYPFVDRDTTVPDTEVQ